jgi:hypothetical protein
MQSVPQAHESPNAQGSCQYFKEICNQERNHINQESSKSSSEDAALFVKKMGVLAPTECNEGVMESSRMGVNRASDERISANNLTKNKPIFRRKMPP